MSTRDILRRQLSEIRASAAERARSFEIVAFAFGVGTAVSYSYCGFWCFATFITLLAAFICLDVSSDHDAVVTAVDAASRDLEYCCIGADISTDDAARIRANVELLVAKAK